VLRTLPTLLSTGQIFQPFIRARPEQGAQFLFGGRFLAKPFSPIGLIQDHRHPVVDFRRRIVWRACKDRAARVRFQCKDASVVL
jgi:hypothetical protein